MLGLWGSPGELPRVSRSFTGHREIPSFPRRWERWDLMVDCETPWKPWKLPAAAAPKLMSIETITPPTHDHIHRGQDKSENDPKFAQNASPEDYKYMICMQDFILQTDHVFVSPREVYSEVVSEHLLIYLGLGVCGHGTRTHSLHT